jgi:hypothetical protein
MLAVGFTTQVIPGTQVHSEEQSTNIVALPIEATKDKTNNESVFFVAPPGTPSWRSMEAPRLLQSDTTEHVQSVVTRIFGAGVDMDLYLPAARTVIDHLTKDEPEDYTKKGLKFQPVGNGGKRWTTCRK